MIKNKNYITKIYKKTSYQNKKTTIKNPYLHYQNVPKPKPDKPTNTPNISNKLQNLTKKLKIINPKS